ncbi:MAG: hypothetical protein FJZ16_06095 [Candidatus Omnitrophica bacterium]|nr:hypothetical protein [Candidatus Omnitrophota bacterium]
MKELYRQKALSQVPRILGFIDRDESSQTFGCSDRYYWHYKFYDLSNARFQEASLLLALLYKYDFENNSFFSNKKIYSWAQATIRFWAQIRNSDGSVNEAYPYERSFCATSLSCCAVTEAMLMLDFNENSWLEKTGLWLKRNNNIEVSNQMAGAVISLYNIYLLTRDTVFKKASEEKVKMLIRNQDSRGYFLEYGGADIGYQTLTLSFLARYYKKSRSSFIIEPIKRGIEAVEKETSNYGNFDYSWTSRKTQFLYPYCFMIFKSEITQHHLKGLTENRVLEPGWLDDRYVIPLTTEYLQTYLEAKDGYDNI